MNNSYWSLLKTRGVARVMGSQLVARFPSGMLSLAFLIHIERIHHSYGAAGLVLAATSVGQAVAGPLTSRWMGRWGIRKVLVPKCNGAPLPRFSSGDGGHTN